MFWNPGDSNPAPSTITNDTPNAPDSAQISYFYVGSGRRLSSPADLILLQDNSLANNAGLGVNALTADQRADFYSISSTQGLVSQGTQAAFSRMFDIRGAILGYATEHSDHLPPRLSALIIRIFRDRLHSGIRWIVIPAHDHQ